ncbi:hypothetical protein CR513_45976, partial [Mucuna pruriens]
MPFASASMAKRSEELGFSLMNTDSANHDRIPGDRHHNDTTAPLPVGSPSPFPHWNLNEVSRCYSNQPAGGNSMIDSSQFKSYQNSQMDHNYSHRGEECNSLPYRPDSRFPCPEGYIGWPHQYNRHDNVTIPADVRSAAFNLNNFEKPVSSETCVPLRYCLASRPQMVNPNGTAMRANIGQPPLDMNVGMTLCNPNQGGAGPLLAIGKFDERFMTIGSGTGSNNIESKSSAVMPKLNVTGNSERAFFPPINTYHNQLGSRSSLNPGLDMNGALSAFQNDTQMISDLAHAGNYEALFDSRPGLRLGPSYAFQRPAAGDQNHYLGQVNRDLGCVKDIGMEFTDVGHKNGLERCMDLNSLPIVGSQTMPFESRQSRANGQLVSSSSGMVTDKLPTELLPKNNDTFSSQFSGSPLAVATRSTRGQDPSSNHGQSQAVGSIQQSNSALRPHSTSGVPTGKGYMAAQVSRPSIMSSLKRAASQPLSSTVQNQHRKTLPTQFIHPSIPTYTRLAPSVPNTPQAISALVCPVQSLTPQATHSVAPPSFPTTWTKSALPAPNTTQAIPPSAHTPPFFLPNDKRISSFHLPSSHTSPRTNQLNRHLITQAMTCHRFKAPIMPSSPSIASKNIKDQTPEPIGYKCFLCKRDLSYAPEGPISQPPVLPPSAVLPCGHTFHDDCLERITPDDQSNDPPCIPCALRE